MLRSGWFVRPLSDHIPDVQLCELTVRVRLEEDINQRIQLQEGLPFVFLSTTNTIRAHRFQPLNLGVSPSLADLLTPLKHSFT